MCANRTKQSRAYPAMTNSNCQCKPCSVIIYCCASAFSTVSVTCFIYEMSWQREINRFTIGGECQGYWDVSLYHTNGGCISKAITSTMGAVKQFFQASVESSCDVTT